MHGMSESTGEYKTISQLSWVYTYWSGLNGSSKYADPLILRLDILDAQYCIERKDCDSDSLGLIPCKVYTRFLPFMTTTPGCSDT
jgi:hypothetical protein